MPARIDKDTEVFIDAARGLAALGVLITHCFDFGIRGAFGGDMADAPEIWRWAVSVIGHGSFFVWVFFILSGLCIHRSISNSMERGTFTITGYLVARVTRIYPLFMTGLTLAIAVWWFSETPASEVVEKPWPQLIASLASLQIFTGTFPNYMPSWSISNEMVYYAAWPFALLLLRRHVLRTLTVSALSSLAVCALIAFSWFGLGRFENSAAVQGLWSVAILYPVWLCGAYLSLRWKPLSQRVTLPLWLLGFALCIPAELALAYVKYIDGPETLVHLTGLAAIPGIAIVVAGARHAGLGSRKHLHSIARWLGQLSYPCYALHMPILVLLNRQLLPHLGEPINTSPLLRALVQFLPTFLLLAATGPWLEQRFMAIRSKILSKLRAAQCPAP